MAACLALEHFPHFVPANRAAELSGKHERDALDGPIDFRDLMLLYQRRDIRRHVYHYQEA